MNELILQQKQNEVSALTAKINESASVVVVDYLGLTVSQVTDLRRRLRAEGCEMKVIKNNIVRRAAKEAGYEELVDSLTGPNAIAFSNEDSIAAAKVLYDFAKDNKMLDLKVGVIDGNYVSNEELMVYATIPSRETLLTMLAAGMMGTVKDLAISLHLYTEEDSEE
ncbi:50S ribosomal protein L10 [Mycoplasmatota bacterium]|nr:50S ribosomal protein L10 [Mycoplasmatota bacterium]